MRWLCFLLASAAAAQVTPRSAGVTPVAKPLRFDLTRLPETRDSFGTYLGHVKRGVIVWQYEVRAAEQHQVVLYTQSSELQPVEEERFRVELDRASGAP